MLDDDQPATHLACSRPPYGPRWAVGVGGSVQDFDQRARGTRAAKGRCGEGGTVSGWLLRRQQKATSSLARSLDRLDSGRSHAGQKAGEGRTRGFSPPGGKGPRANASTDRSSYSQAHRASAECRALTLFFLVRENAVTNTQVARWPRRRSRSSRSGRSPSCVSSPRPGPPFAFLELVRVLTRTRNAIPDPTSRSATSRTVTTVSRRHGASPRVSTTASVAASRASSRCPRSVTAATRRPATSSRAGTRSSWSTTSVTSSRSS